MEKRLWMTYRQKMSEEPVIQQILGDIYMNSQPGGDASKLPSLQENLKNFINSKSSAIYHAVKGDLDPTDVSNILGLSDAMAQNLFNQAAQGARQKEQIAQVEKPNTGLRAGELGVKQREATVAEKKLALEPTGRKFSDEETAWRQTIARAQNFLVGQGIQPTVEQAGMGGLNLILKVPNPLKDPAVQGQALGLLNQIDQQIIEGKTPLSSGQKQFLQKVYNVGQINKEGLPSPETGRFPSEPTPAQAGQIIQNNDEAKINLIVSDYIKSHPEAVGPNGQLPDVADAGGYIPYKSRLVNPPGRPGTFLYIGSAHWIEIK